MRHGVLCAIVFGLVLSFAQSSAPAQTPELVQLSTSDEANYRRLQSVFGFALTGEGEAIEPQRLFQDLDQFDAAERAIAHWPEQGLPRAQVRLLLDTLLQMRAMASSYAQGNYSELDIRSMAAPLDGLTASVSRETQPDLWRNMSLMRVQLRAMLAMLAGDDTPLGEIDTMLADPIFAGDQITLRMLRATFARGATASWAGASPVVVADLHYIIAHGDEFGQSEMARKARISLAEMLLALRRTETLPETAAAVDLAELPAAMAALEEVDWPLAERGEPLRLRVFDAHQRGADLTQLTQQWFDAVTEFAAAEGAPLWSHPDVLQWYIAGPLLAGNGREAVVRQARASELLRYQPLQAPSALTSEAAVPWTPPPPTQLPGDGALFSRLSVDGIVTLTPSAGVGGAQMAIGRRQGRRVRWEVRDSGTETFDVLDVEAARGTASAYQELAQVRGMGDASELVGSATRSLFRMRFDTNPLAPDNAIFAEFGAAIDAAFGGRCAAGVTDDAPLRVLLVKGAEFSFVPIHLARAPNGRRLIECYTFLHAPDVLTALEASERRARAGRPSGVVGVWNPSGDLPLAEAEHAFIQRAFGAERVRAPRAGAISQALFADDASASEILHIAAHGRVSILSPFQSGVGLGGEDGRILVRDLLSGRLRARRDLVVLSACESGLAGTSFGPIAYYSLPNGFLRAGAGGVVSTLWSVRDDAAALVMGRFYRNYLERRMAPAEALREAQLWLSTASVADLLASIDEAAPAGSADGALPFARLRTAVLQQRRRVGESAPPYGDTRLWGGFAYFGAGER